MSAVHEDKEYCVTCPRCGRVNLRTFTTDSFIKCSKCSYEFYVYINDGVAIVMDAASIEGTKSRMLLLNYAKALSKLKDHQGTD